MLELGRSQSSDGPVALLRMRSAQSEPVLASRFAIMILSCHEYTATLLRPTRVPVQPLLHACEKKHTEAVRGAAC
eukprot:5861585-Amphidinium_carterae.1